MTQYKDIIINDNGYFGEFGGAYIAEPLIPIMSKLNTAFQKLKTDPQFLSELHTLYSEYIGRPSPLTHAKNLSEKLGGANIYIKNEGLNHTGAHKINHVVGQILIAKYLGKKRIIAETGAGQHGLATASACAKFGLPCTIYMGKKDYDRQRPNVYYMELAGAKVIAVHEGQQSLRDAVNASIQALINDSQESYYLLGTACGPHPYPSMNVFFQKIIGEEIQKQFPKTPDYLISCVGGGSNSLGLFYNFLDSPSVQMIGVEAGGKSKKLGSHAARFYNKKIGVTQGYKSYFIQNRIGQLHDTHSISAGLDYAGVSPQIAFLEQEQKIKIVQSEDSEVLDALRTLMETEGILGALESCHAVAYAIKLAPTLDKTKDIVIGLSGRGDKDLFISAPLLDTKFNSYLHNIIKNEQ